MNAKVYAEFLSRQGYHIVKTESCYWYDAHPAFYFYFPYHKLINPNDDELKRVFWGSRCTGMRFFTPMDCIGKSSYMLVCSDKNYDLTSVDAKTARRQTRRGLENFEIKQFGLDELAKLGHVLYSDTLIRQGRNPLIWTERKWKEYCKATEGLDGFEAWGAFSHGKLSSFMMGFQMEDHFTILHQCSATEYLRGYPNNALVFSVTRLKLALSEVNTVSYGPESLDAPESLDTFKLRMGYQQRPMKQRIIFNPLIGPFVGGLLHKSVRLAVMANPQSDTLRKIEGIIRFYREAI